MNFGMEHLPQEIVWEANHGAFRRKMQAIHSAATGVSFGMEFVVSYL
jgi:hypothetical protein